MVRDTGFEAVTLPCQDAQGLPERSLPSWATRYEAMRTHANAQNVTVKCYNKTGGIHSLSAPVAWHAVSNEARVHKSVPPRNI